MGALHEGHLALVRAARARADVVAVSIFVNPTQFGPGEDLGAYPRDLPRDLELLGAEGVDLVFTPNPDSMYEPDAQVTVDPGPLGMVLEGAARPGHFSGVATVVTKLFAIVMPDVAFLGEKDYQQLLVVRRLVTDLDFPISVVGVPTEREIDGLALSSRNAYLDPAQRGVAPVLYHALHEAGRLAQRGESDVARLETSMAEVLRTRPEAAAEYAVVRDAATLEPIARLEPGRPARALVAARVGAARLIDNAAIELGDYKPHWEYAKGASPSTVDPQ